MAPKEIIDGTEESRKKEEKRRMWIRIGHSVIGWLSVSLVLSISAGIILEVNTQEILNFRGYLGLFVIFCICFFPIDYYIEGKFKKR